jgi:hypothetical protein
MINAKCKMPNAKGDVPSKQDLQALAFSIGIWH